MSELSIFDPDSIQTMLDIDLVHGLRMLADVIESGLMTGRLTSAQGVGGSVLVKLIVTAPIRRLKSGKDLRLEDET